MDANGLRFWMLAEEKDWQFATDAAAIFYDRDRRCLQLNSRRTAALPVIADLAANRTAAEERLVRVPQSRDGYDTRAFWAAGEQAVLATGAVAGVTPIFKPPTGETPTDLVMGFDGILYLALDGRVVMVDPRARWQPGNVTLTDFVAWRLAAMPGNGVWVLDRAGRQVARLRGEPLPDRLLGEFAPQVFRPQPENPNPPHLTAYALADLGVRPGETPVALACHPTSGELVILCWVDNAEAVLYRWPYPGPTQRVILTDAHHPYSLAWVGRDRIGLLAPELEKEALVYVLPPGVTRVAAVGDFYPVRAATGEPFVHGLNLPPHYVTGTGTTPLHHLSLASFASTGAASGGHVLDSGSRQTTWHRLYLEAVLPPHCGVTLWLAASDQAQPPAADNVGAWFEHRFGPGFAHDGQNSLPHGAWVSHPSELPFHPGLLPCPRQRDQAGLFTVLIQRTGRRTSLLRGRYLHVRLGLYGDGRTTPEVYAVRAYAARFSYIEKYLPALYHETLMGEEADAASSPNQPPSPADFLERFVDNFEGILTPLEDRINDAWLLTDARTVPADALAWLGSWIGVAFAPVYPLARRRQLLAAAPQLFRRRGTLAGLAQALNIATGGAVAGGEIVIVEDWRLRRTFTTILGADLAAEDDPLLAGLTVSGNSLVGDTLFLGDFSDEQRKEFLALFAADLAQTPAETAAVAEFLDRLAYRVTVLVHQAVEPQDLGLIRQIVDLEKPAHLDTQIFPASEALRVGMAALVGVDTYLDRKAKPGPVRVGESQLGVRDLIQRPASLDPRLEGGRLVQGSEPPRQSLPVARLAHPDQVQLGELITLDASASQAAPGHRITKYIWTRIA